MKKNIVIYGAQGKIGQAITHALSCKYNVLENDISHFGCTASYNDADYIVTALPAKSSFNLLKEILETTTGKIIVDVSYMIEDVFLLKDLARQNGHVLISDAGLAPGLTNLFCGHRFSEDGYLETALMYVGGVEDIERKTYRVQNTWNINDLEDEYKRFAGLIKKGTLVNSYPFDIIEEIEIPGFGKMEAFISDGCRTLLKTMRPYEMREMTLRYSGHIKQIKEAIENDMFSQLTLCHSLNDRVVFYCKLNDYSYTMIDEFSNSFTAMQRTTGFTAAIVMDCLIERAARYNSGILTMEDLGQDTSFNYITEQLDKGYGIKFKKERWRN